MDILTVMLYPPLEPFQTHFLKVSTLHTLYFEESGNPEGIPILFLHGGPGGGTEPIHRQLYDPHQFRIILVDQRGCGKSTPFAELAENTTWDLIEDLEKIREQLGISSWLVHGGSWGSTLALLYAITHPTHIKGLLLRGIFLCRAVELAWLYQGGAHWVFPDAWDNYQSLIPSSEQDDFIEAYYRRLTGSDPVVQLEAARRWSQWEACVSKLIPDPDYILKYDSPQKNLPFARIETHYFKHRAFLPTDNYILDHVERLRHLPFHIIHGRYDMVCPVKNAWDLHKALPQSRLNIVPQAGHSLFEPSILEAVMTGCRSLLILAGLL